MNILLLIAVLIVMIAIPTYPKWSYKKWYERMECAHERGKTDERG